MLARRQQLLLKLLDALGGKVAKLDFQKLLLIYTLQFETSPSYEFVPYSYGCFSFNSYADKRRLIQKGLLTDEEDTWHLADAGRIACGDFRELGNSLERFRANYGTIRGDQLIGLTYRCYPYFAIRSQILRRILPDAADRERVRAARPPRRGPGLLTIGYEGKSLETYLNQLLRNSVSVLCDIRRNPLSRKYGFSKSTLQNACEGLGIRYEHLPELGIASHRRRDLSTADDYASLFTDYRRNDLPRERASLERIVSWIRPAGGRVALTCFEFSARQCHRQCVAESVSTLLGSSFDVCHLEGACQPSDYSLR
ncbi:MAG: DUF488 domain-containing protein [Candidatus Hydrogenedentes bacterium]|nr:DUF488 domain-containing protein [Candidatus Hydrogenedentota bacterium]